MSLLRLVNVDGLNNLVVLLSREALSAVGVEAREVAMLLRRATSDDAYEVKLGAACGRFLGDRFGIGEDLRRWPTGLPDEAALAIASALPHAAERTNLMRAAGKRVPLIVYSNDLARALGDDPTDVRDRYRASASSGGEYETLVRRIKQADLSLDDRAERLGDALLALVGWAGTAASPAVPSPAATEPWRESLHPAARRFVDSAERMAPLLSGLAIDWSGVVIGYCKAMEVEAVERLIEPLREDLRGAVPQSDLDDPDVSRVARYCARPDRARPPELGTLQYFLATAAHSRKRAESSTVIRAFKRLVGGWSGGAWILSDDGAVGGFRDLTTRYRNRAAHTAELTESDYEECRELVVGSGGLLPRLVTATT